EQSGPAVLATGELPRPVVACYGGGLMQRLQIATLMVVVAGLTGAARAQDKSKDKAKKDEKPNPTGTWKWTVDIGGPELERVLKLKLEGDKLTGTLAGTMAEEAKIEDPKYKDGEVTFKVQRDFGGTK